MPEREPARGRWSARLRAWLVSEALQAGLLAALFVCVWWAIGLLTGVLLASAVVYFTPASARWPAVLILTLSILSCGIYGSVRGWKLFRMRIPRRSD